MGEITKSIEAFNEPICKLIDAMQKGAGVLYEPHHLKKMANAKAYAIDKIGDAIRRNSDLPIVYQGKDTDLCIDISDANSLVERTKHRILFRETRKQQNLDSIASKTFIQLEDKTDCDTEPVNQDWMVRFINAAQDVSDDELQNLWSKILAGEIIKPKSCSFRTLEILKNMSKDEFDMFLKICPFICEQFLSDEGGLLEKYGIEYEMILILDECGLINSGGLITRRMNVEKNTIILSTKKYILAGTVKANKSIPMSITVYPLTEAGKKLYLLSECNFNINFLREYYQFINKKYPYIAFSIYDRITRRIVKVEELTNGNQT